MNLRKGASLIVMFIAGVIAGSVVPMAVRRVAAKAVFPENQHEIQRVTSPDSRVDAVAEQSDCGAPCSAQYSISIVPKGAPASNELRRQLLVADDATKLQIRWQEPQLLVIEYDRARIDRFQNVVYPLSKEGNVESWNYAVEGRLEPLSHYSYLHR
jgi:hypothetical protein